MFVHSSLSLADLAGEAYARNLALGRSLLGGESPEECQALAFEKIDLYPECRQNHDAALALRAGEQIMLPFVNENRGAPTDSFRKADHPNTAPLGGMGCVRLGEDGRLYLIGKSEHYHASLGHSFPGYKLIDIARKLGVPNATHNNTRGYLTRLCERELIRAANGIADHDDAALEQVLASKNPHVINRVINLETGSLAVEAGVKMMLARFYKLSPEFPTPKYDGRIPVFFTMADREGGPEANYHGTTVLTQTMRGLWPQIRQRAENELYKVVSVPINDIEAFRKLLKTWNTPPYKTAGFMHEIVLMNYGGVRLEKDFLQAAHEACRETDTPTMVDEIQSCMWYPGMFLYRVYGLTPDFAIVGKGFPGGEYPASKILTTAEMDNLNQFGALVTNGQEELASLAYLITMRFSRDNAALIGENGDYFQAGMEKLAAAHPALVECAEGYGLLAALHFHTLDLAKDFAHRINDRCIDVSAQTYKPNCPPSVLVKPPLTAGQEILDFILNAFAEALNDMDA